VAPQPLSEPQLIADQCPDMPFGAAPVRLRPLGAAALCSNGINDVAGLTRRGEAVGGARPGSGRLLGHRTGRLI
jgi:hypothetical protein